MGEGGERAAAAPCTARRSNPMPEQKYMVYARLGERAAILALSLDEAGRRRRRRSGGGGGQGICRYISTALITKKGFLFLRATKKGLFSYATCKQPRDYLINVDDDANATSQSIARSTCGQATSTMTPPIQRSLLLHIPSTQTTSHSPPRPSTPSTRSPYPRPRLPHAHTRGQRAKVLPGVLWTGHQTVL